jgi:tRNA 5-methylaminomethyl-2-thiouridine biosynthesis bifunctional protein
VRYDQNIAEITRTKGGWRVGEEDFEAVILACAKSILDFKTTAWLPLQTVRGQITKCIVSESAPPLKTALCYGGYITPKSQDGSCIVGSTFQKWRDDTTLDAQDDTDNLQKLAAHAPDYVRALTITGARAALRVAAQDRVPVCGQVYDREGAAQENLYISAAHGSHGLLSSLGAAMVITAEICKQQPAFYNETLTSLSPERFLLREKKRAARS